MYALYISSITEIPKVWAKMFILLQTKWSNVNYGKQESHSWEIRETLLNIKEGQMVDKENHGNG